MNTQPARNAVAALLSPTTAAECTVITTTLDEADSLFAQINGLSTAPALPPPMPIVNFRTGETNGPLGTLRTYGGGENGAFCVQIAWNAPADGATVRLQQRSNPGNPMGPDDWTDIQHNAIIGPDGENATWGPSQAAGSVVLLRLVTELNGQTREVVIGYVIPDLTPAE